jgi:hypothetical protein
VHQEQSSDSESEKNKTTRKQLIEKTIAQLIGPTEMSPEIIFMMKDLQA